MRWDALFEDLQAQWAAVEDRAQESEIAERARMDHGALTLAARLRAAEGRSVRVLQADGEVVEGIVGFTGEGWTCLRSGPCDVVVVHQWCRQWDGLGRVAAPDPRSAGARLGLTSALRGLSRDRSVVTVVIAVGDRPRLVRGRVERVGRDFFDVTPVHPGEVRPDGARTTTLPTGACLRVTSLAAA